MNTNHDAVGDEELSKIWSEKPELIRAFLDLRPQYEQLVSEVAYILKKRLTEKNVEVAAVTGRAKTMKSFAGKISRKAYKDPLKEITDFAGVRCVYLYLSDRSSIEAIIESDFEIVEKVNKLEEKKPEEFGYGALHYLVKLGKKTSGARYDDLKDLICEIQVRTVVQDSWAIIDHHLVYKQEGDAPSILRRKLNSLAGLFETADSQFDQIRNEREKYREQLAKEGKTKEPVAVELNLDSLVEFLKTEFPGKKPSVQPTQITECLSRLKVYGYKDLDDVRKMLDNTKAARAELRKIRVPPASVWEVNRGIALENEKARLAYYTTGPLAPSFKKVEHLLKSNKR
jgi:ppGpp synthetase/RelA/SpoT-type nucleotidyltranferase